MSKPDDLARAAAFVQALPQHALTGVVNVYRLFFSAWLGASCRFEPSCSAYALQALEQHGAAHGSYLTLRRLIRCQPWCEGGHDPVPASGTALFSSLVTPVTSHSSEKTPS